jgi:hypothetical protein
MIRRWLESKRGETTAHSEFVVDEVREVRADAVTLVDDALQTLGGDVVHAIDPERILSFRKGGPPVWSVGQVSVEGARPYTLFVTYGLSNVLCPDPARPNAKHEYSLAVPLDEPSEPWAVALLRHACRAMLNGSPEILVGGCVPFDGAPLTRIAFQPEHHAMMPDTQLVGLVCTPDPVLPKIATPYGAIEVRRLVGVDQPELDRIETWSPRGFIEELWKRDPHLLTSITRDSWLADSELRAAVERRAVEEGSDVEIAGFDIAWARNNREVKIELPQGRAADRLREAIYGRVGFGRILYARTRARDSVIIFDPDAEGIKVVPHPRMLVIGGAIDSLTVRVVLWGIERGSPAAVFRI